MSECRFYQANERPESPSVTSKRGGGEAETRPSRRWGPPPRPFIRCVTVPPAERKCLRQRTTRKGCLHFAAISGQGNWQEFLKSRIHASPILRKQERNKNFVLCYCRWSNMVSEMLKTHSNLVCTADCQSNADMIQRMCSIFTKGTHTNLWRKTKH